MQTHHMKVEVEKIYNKYFDEHNVYAFWLYCVGKTSWYLYKYFDKDMFLQTDHTMKDITVMKTKSI